MENKNNYDLTVLLESEDSSSLTSLLGKIKAEEIKADSLIKINLAYPIKKKDTAFMGVFKFGSESESIKMLEKEIKVMPGILRHMLLKDEQKSKKTSIKKISKESKVEKLPREKSEFKKDSDMLTNEAIEKKIEEIMN